MTAIREPRTIEAATKLAERFAELETAIGVADAVRNDAIAKANAAADEEIAPLIEERDAIAAKVGSWWGKNGREQVLGRKPKQKSAELGGCLLGSQKSRASLKLPEDEDKLIERMKGSRALKKLLRVKESIDITDACESYYKQLFPLNPGGIVPTPAITAESLNLE